MCHSLQAGVQRERKQSSIMMTNEAVRELQLRLRANKDERRLTVGIDLRELCACART